MKLIIFIAIILSFASCTKKENPYVSKDVIDALIGDQTPDTIKNISFIYNNDVYYLPYFEGTAERITYSSSLVKTKLKMSFDHQSFAYLNNNGFIEIIDLQGNILNTLTQYGGVKSFDWNQDNASLYILNNYSLEFYGVTMDIPTRTFPSTISSYSNKKIIDLSISIDGDIAYIVEYFNPLIGTIEILVVKPNDGSDTELIFENENNYGMSYVRFSNNSKDLTLGYKSGSSTVDLDQFDMFKDLNMTPVFQWDISGYYLNPIYNSEFNCFMYCVKNFSSDSFVLSSMDMETFEEVSKDEYTNSTSTLYLDWKQ